MDDKTLLGFAIETMGNFRIVENMLSKQQKNTLQNKNQIMRLSKRVGKLGLCVGIGFAVISFGNNLLQAQINELKKEVENLKKPTEEQE